MGVAGGTSGTHGGLRVSGSPGSALRAEGLQRRLGEAPAALCGQPPPTFIQESVCIRPHGGFGFRDERAVKGHARVEAPRWQRNPALGARLGQAPSDIVTLSWSPL